MYLDKETQKIIAGFALHASILAWSVAEDIEETHPERAAQMRDQNEKLGALFNIFNPKEGLEIEAHFED